MAEQDNRHGLTRWSNLLAFGSVCVFTLIIECGIIFFAIQGRLDLTWLLSAHLGLCVLIAGIGMRLHRGALREQMVFLSIWVLISGAAGVVIGLSQYFGRARSIARVQTDFEEILALEARQPDEERIDEIYDQVVDNRLNTDQSVNLLPFQEQINTGTRAEKLNLLRVVGKEFGPEFSDVIQVASVSPDAAVRVMAATISAKIKQDYTTEIQMALASLSEDPDSLDRQVDAAKAYLAFSESGILGEDLAAAQQAKAEQILSSTDLSLSELS